MLLNLKKKYKKKTHLTIATYIKYCAATYKQKFQRVYRDYRIWGNTVDRLCHQFDFHRFRIKMFRPTKMMMVDLRSTSNRTDLSGNFRLLRRHRQIHRWWWFESRTHAACGAETEDEQLSFHLKGQCSVSKIPTWIDNYRLIKQTRTQAITINLKEEIHVNVNAKKKWKRITNKKFDVIQCDKICVKQSTINYNVLCNNHRDEIK